MIFCLAFFLSIAIESISSSQGPSDVTITLNKVTKEEIYLELNGHFSLGTTSSDPEKRAATYYNIKEGQTLHIFIDERPYFLATLKDAYTNLEQKEPFIKELKIPIPFPLEEGTHLVTIVPAKSYKESIKVKGAFISKKLDVQNGVKPSLIESSDHNLPLLLWHAPEGVYPKDRSDPLLLDFQIIKNGGSANVLVELFKGETKLLSKMVNAPPYRLIGLTPGDYSIKVSMRGESEKYPWNSFTRTFTILP